MTELERWEKEAQKNKELKKQLSLINKTELEEAFSGNLSFGTGGM